MTFRIRNIMVLPLLFLLGVANSQQKQQFALLKTGVFHGMDVPLHQPKQWQGLFCKDLRCSFHAVQIETRPTIDEVGDDPPGVKSATEVFLVGVHSHEPLFLVRGLGFKARSLQALFVGQREMQTGDEFAFGPTIDGFLLKVEGKKTEEEPLPKGSKLFLVRGQQKQELFALPDGGNDPYITVLWIGDLDGDGKPDLIIDMSDHYNVSRKVLLLSSQAKKGDLVGSAAVLQTEGC